MSIHNGTGEWRHLLVTFPQKAVSFERGEGASLYTVDGVRYVDLGGASQGVANFGHAHPRIVDAIRRQADRLIHTTMTVPSAERSTFLERLHALLPSHLSRSFLANSGTEAVEAAIKIAHARTGRRHIVALRQGFHGRSLGSLSATFKPAYRKPFESMLQPVTFVPANDEAALEAAVTDQTSLVLVEPIQGEGGQTVLTDAFLRACQRVAHEKGALLAVDEIQTGLGRTGRDLAIQGTGVRPDLLLLGKSLAGGLPIGVCAATEEAAKALPPASHGTTFGGSPLVCAAATAALDVLREERLSERAAAEGERLLRRLRGMDVPLVREVRGRGLMVGLELTIKPQPVLDQLLQSRFLALPAGVHVVRLLPPLVTRRDDLDAASDALQSILEDPALAPTPPEATP